MLNNRRDFRRNQEPAVRSAKPTRDRGAKPRRRTRLELTALEPRQVLSTITGYSLVEQQGLPAPQTTVISSPTAFQTQIDQAWQNIASGQQKIGMPPQTLAQLASTNESNAAIKHGVTANDISPPSFGAKGTYSAVLDSSGASPVLRILYKVSGNQLNFKTTTPTPLGSYADPVFNVTYNLTISVNLTLPSNPSPSNPVGVTATAQVDGVVVKTNNVLANVADNVFGAGISQGIADGLNNQSTVLTSTVSSQVSQLNTALNFEAAKGFTHFQYGLDGAGNLVLTGEKPDLVVNGVGNDHIVVASSPNGSVQITEGGRTASFDPGYLHSITINTALDGQSTVQVQGTPAGVKVNVIDGVGSLDTVTIGNGSLAGLGGPVNVTSNSSPTKVTVDDSADTANRQTTITNSSVQISGLPVVTYSGQTLAGVTVLGGTGTDNYFVNSTAATTPVSVVTGYGVNTVYVGNGSLAGIAGAVNVQQSKTSTTGVVVDDYKESGRNATLTSNSLSFTGVPAITFSGINTLEVVGGSGNNTIAVNSVAPATSVTIYQNRNTVIGPAASSAKIYAGIPVADLLGGTTTIIH